MLLSCSEPPMYIKTDNFRNYQRKIRIRGLSGTAKSKTLSLSNNSVQLIWNGWGIGHTMMKLEEKGGQKNEREQKRRLAKARSC